ncbi:LodA/GoxA family CTQ-dependent oxidase [Aureivirga marina]|uniref:LodA/GoxA family CTQ-dependent oxidase n=1 Tax=Aureivirga marina TaxID=1182451 RepID=UPI0018C90B62|nr:LodA/GoxA family CTQ-dependent oxidase [Aureivirga marina]
MSENKDLFRIHPAIGIARVGTSSDYYLGPESMAGLPDEKNPHILGGLPMKPNTDDKIIDPSDIRDAEGRLKKQAARFKIFAYDSSSVGSYPSGEGEEITIGSTFTYNGKKVMLADIYWTVHLANKKANSYIIPEEKGILAYENGQTPPLRNLDFTGKEDESVNDIERLKKLVIDAGPHTISNGEEVEFDAITTNSFYDFKNGVTKIDYPKIFPNYTDGKHGGDAPEESRIETLGTMKTDDKGRLLVIGAYGKASSFENETAYYDPTIPLDSNIDNDNFFDDTADGYVTAVLKLKLEDSSGCENPFIYVKEIGNSWVVSTDPSFAPQIPNIVSLWEDIYNTWIEDFNLSATVFNPNTINPNPDHSPYYVGNGFNLNYKPHYSQDILPLITAVDLQQWACNFDDTAVSKHKMVSELGPNPKAQLDGFNLLAYIRNPNLNPETEQFKEANNTRMPLSLGDTGQPLLTVSRTQYFYLSQWLNGKINENDAVFGSGEKLDRNILANCLGGRFSPGIEMTFIVRDPNLYLKNGSSISDILNTVGPFRINMKEMDYSNLSKPFLTSGYYPKRTHPVEPGDICKFMALPWHTDYNSCATHQTDPNPDQSLLTYWSWPAQRPVAVYTYNDFVADEGMLSFKRYSVRGEGTDSPNIDDKGEPVLFPSQEVGRYQIREEFVKNWHRIGTIMQGNSILNLHNSLNVLSNGHEMTEKEKEDLKKIKDLMEMKVKLIEKEKNLNRENPAELRMINIELGSYLENIFVEVESQFEIDESNLVENAPLQANTRTSPPMPTPKCPHSIKTNDNLNS